MGANGPEEREPKPQNGLKFKFVAVEIKLVKNVLEFNGFVDVSSKGEDAYAEILWSSCMIKSSVY